MNNDIKEYLKEISSCKNDMLSNYKDLIVAYENSRQLYEKVIDEYVAGTSQCSQLVGYVYTASLINWRIVLLDGTEVYSSSDKLEWETWILDLSTLKLEPGTQFKLSASSGIDNDNFSGILEYIPNSNTSYYCYNFRSSQSNNIHHLGTISSPTSPPILKCSSISAHLDATFITKYELRAVDGSGTIYTSGRYRKGSNWNADLSKLNIQPGTKFRLHSGVIAGSDSEAYVILEYDPTSTTTANFTLTGITAKTCTLYGTPWYKF